MEIIYLDNKIIVCRKPCDVLSTDERGGMPSLLRTALGDEGAPVYTVHRLDAAVGGLMVYARTRHAAADLGAAMAAGGFHKEYLAVVHGGLREKSGEMRDLLWRDRRRGMTYVTDQPAKDAREAALEYAVLTEREGLSLVQIRLITGRTHQIRCQFSHRGSPLWGDRKYGRGDDGGNVALWSHRLDFDHPATKEPMSFLLPPPEEYPWTLFCEDGSLWKQS